MRRLMWLTVGFGGFCALWAAGGSLPWYLPLILCAVFAALRKGRAAMALLGCTLAILWCGHYGEACLPSDLDGQVEPVTIRITDFGYDTSYGTAADGILTRNGRPFQVRAYLNEKQDLVPGQDLRGSFRFRLTTPDGADTYHAGKGIFLLVYQNGEVEVGTSAERSWRDFPARLRNSLLSILDACFPADAAPFAKALLLGDTRELSYQVDTSFKVSGIRHVVAVSGLHVSILFALLTAVTFHRRFLTALVGFPALLLFAAVSGFTPSVNRACIMAALMLLSMLTSREYDGPTALSFAALTMLILNPLVITSVSFQLSVASVAGIYLFYPPIYTWLQGGRKHWAWRWFASSVSISLSAMVLTVPLCAYHFGTVSLVGPLTNLLTLWLISFIFYGCMAVCLLSQIWMGGAVLLAKLVAVPIRYVLVTARLLSKFPLAAVYTASPYIVFWLIFVYVLLAVFRFQKKKQPLVLFCCAALGLSMALTASFAEPMLDDVRFTVLDVGQGQCLLLQNRGRTYMVDCGGDRAADKAAETLLSQGIAKLDGLILTHLDADHAGDVQNFLTRVDTDVLILPPIPTETEFSTAGRTLYAADDLRFSFDGSSVTVFASQITGTDNENSLCVLFDTEKCDILITGDRDGLGERMLLRNEAIPKVDILVAGHHGSKHSTCEALLEAADPEIVCISVGRDNPYGHPAPETLKRLSGRQIYRTDQNGTILIRR